MRIGKLRWTAATIALLAGCGGEESKQSDTSGTASGPDVSGEVGFDAGPDVPRSDIRWREDTYRELDGDEENPERLIATAIGKNVDSMKVRFEIRTSKDDLLYRHEWPADSYLKYADDGAALDSTRVLAETQKQIRLIFAESQFIIGANAARSSGKTEPDLDAIKYYLAEQQYRVAHKLPKWSEIKGAEAWNEINTISRTIAEARVKAIAAETRDKPAFRYWAGGEETYVVAWSPTEKRMVRIAACC